MTKEEIKAIIKDFYDNFEKEFDYTGSKQNKEEAKLDLLSETLFSAINKPVETTNEKPIEVHIYNNWEETRVSCDDSRVKLIQH
jgi:hypothetical protein